jgi:hypothetical protein
MGVQPTRRQRRITRRPTFMDDDEDRPITILLDRQDDVRVTAGLLASHDPARGRVVVHPTPGIIWPFRCVVCPCSGSWRVMIAGLFAGTGGRFG